MSRDSNINQFIPLHFYEPSERMPEMTETDDYKIVIVKTYNGIDFRIAYYDVINRKWYDDHNYPIENDKVIAWASFSPEWVTGTYPGEWGKQ